MSLKSSFDGNDGSMGKHPADEELYDYFVSETLTSDTRKRELDAHIAVCPQCSSQGQNLQETEAKLERLKSLALTTQEQKDLDRSLARLRAVSQPTTRTTLQKREGSRFCIFEGRRWALGVGFATAVVAISLTVIVYRVWRANQAAKQEWVKVGLSPKPKSTHQVEPSPVKEKEREEKQRNNELFSKRPDPMKPQSSKLVEETTSIVQLNVEESAEERGGNDSITPKPILRVPASGVINIRIKLPVESEPGTYGVRLENAYLTPLTKEVKGESLDGEELNVSLNLREFKSGVYYIGVVPNAGAPRHVQVKLVRS